MTEPERCSNCDRPLRPWLRGFCARCVTTPKQRERLAVSAEAISKEGPVGRALDILGVAVLIVASIVAIGLVWAWLGFTGAVIALVIVLVLGALGFLGAG